ncbi:unnamed protein product [Schistosoma curassoni]|uniref:Uncharacterized protein n=1 Tax=Schistosoma curassoni TaxID=6186 RepID=A0A183JR40_9TREM|nr:unnamed protein product [Schistosoma curassoni]
MVYDLFGHPIFPTKFYIFTVECNWFNFSSC